MRTEEKKLRIKNRDLPRFVEKWVNSVYDRVAQIAVGISLICTDLLMAVAYPNLSVMVMVAMIGAFITALAYAGITILIVGSLNERVYNYTRCQLAALLDYPVVLVRTEFGRPETEIPALDKEPVQACLALFAHLIEAMGGLQQAPDALAADFAEARKLVAVIYPDIKREDLKVEALLRGYPLAELAAREELRGHKHLVLAQRLYAAKQSVAT